MIKSLKSWNGKQDKKQTNKQKQTHNNNATNAKAQLFYLLGKQLF